MRAIRLSGHGAAHLRNYFVHEILKDGTRVTVRAVRPEDGPAILDAFGKLDKDSVYRRFFSPKKELSGAELSSLTEVDLKQVVALVVTTQITMQMQDCEVLIAGGRFAVVPSAPSRVAELAFLTGKDYRGRGIASLLLRHLAELGRNAGLSAFEADVLADNEAMLNVFRRSGLALSQRREGSVIHLNLSLL
jgi:RimJ/RimL family protein N-acetyltransferase